MLMDFNDFYKYESGFIFVKIGNNNFVMLFNLEGSILGVWIFYGEGKFDLKGVEIDYNIIVKYGYEVYFVNFNGSVYNIVMFVSVDGCYLVMMLYIECFIFFWNWVYYFVGC